MKQPKDEERLLAAGMNRRDFLKRLGYASVVALAAGSGGLALYDSKGPASSPAQKVLTGLGDYTLRGKSPGPGKMAIVRGTDRALMLARGVEALGGMESFVQKGDRVLIKVNAAFATPPSLGATTHPEVLAAVAGLCVKAGAAQVLVTDNPINDPDSCFEISGLGNGGSRRRGQDHYPPGLPYLPPSACHRANSSRIGPSWPGSSRE